MRRLTILAATAVRTKPGVNAMRAGQSAAWVAILENDVHQGNGRRDIFWGRAVVNRAVLARKLTRTAFRSVARQDMKRKSSVTWGDMSR